MSVLIDSLVSSLALTFEPVLAAVFAVGAILLSLTIAYFSAIKIIQMVTGNTYTFKHGRFYTAEQYVHYVGTQEWNLKERASFYKTPRSKRSSRYYKYLLPHKDKQFLDEYKKVYGKDYKYKDGS